jgi:hypothetical protein
MAPEPVDCGRDLAGDQQDRVPRIISEAICCGLLMSGRKLAIAWLQLEGEHVVSGIS